MERRLAVWCWSYITLTCTFTAGVALLVSPHSINLYDQQTPTLISVSVLSQWRRRMHFDTHLPAVKLDSIIDLYLAIHTVEDMWRAVENTGL